MESEKYKYYWRTILMRCFGWSSEQVSEWASQFAGRMSDEHSDFWHESPAYYLVEEIAPEHIMRRLVGKDFYRVFSDIQGAIEGVPKPIGENELVDMDATCDRIRRTLQRIESKYGNGSGRNGVGRSGAVD